MPRLDRRTFQDLSEKTGFQIDTLEKVYRLIELLREINQLETGEKYILKGGTAINFLYFEFPRLSVDIDLDYIGSVKKKEMLKDREKSEKILSKMFNTLDYEVERNDSYALQQHQLYYENSAGNRDRIELEINFLKRTTCLEPIKKELKHFYNFGNFEVHTLTIEELYGRKTKALVKRATARDLYDVHKLLESDLEFNEELMKKCFLFHLCLNEDPRKTSLEKFKEISRGDVRKKLLPLLRKKDEVKLTQMKNNVRPLLERFLSYTENEKKFIESLFNEKTYNPEILFNKGEYNKELEKHPGMKWRLKKNGEETT